MLAVAADPSNAEYQLHYRRSCFNASQMFMTQGRSLAEQRDYIGAYNAFRQAFGYDPVNQLAVSEMERMLRLQEVKDRNERRPATPHDRRHRRPRRPHPPAPTGSLPPPKPEQVRVINYSGDLKGFIRTLADQPQPECDFRSTVLCPAAHDRCQPARCDDRESAGLHLSAGEPVLSEAGSAHDSGRRSGSPPTVPATGCAHVLHFQR